MCERLKQTVLKTVIPERVSGVRIPLPPPDSLQLRESFSNFARIRPFSGLFIDWVSSEWALHHIDQQSEFLGCQMDRPTPNQHSSGIWLNGKFAGFDWAVGGGGLQQHSPS